MRIRLEIREWVYSRMSNPIGRKRISSHDIEDLSDMPVRMTLFMCNNLKLSIVRYYIVANSSLSKRFRVQVATVRFVVLLGPPCPDKTQDVDDCSAFIFIFIFRSGEEHEFMARNSCFHCSFTRAFPVQFLH